MVRWRSKSRAWSTSNIASVEPEAPPGPRRFFGSGRVFTKLDAFLYMYGRTSVHVDLAFARRPLYIAHLLSSHVIMAGKQAAAAGLEEALQKSRKERNEKLAQTMLGHDPKKLAQEMLGKSRRINTPVTKAPLLPLSARAGVVKRSASLPRSNTAPPARNLRQPSHLSRPPMGENYRPRASFNAPTSSDPVSVAKSNGYVERPAAVNGAPELTIRGAATTGPTVIRAQNFAPGTTAADIESVMSSIGGETTFCKLVSAAPTVIAEMGFVERSGAEKVIDMFNNKKVCMTVRHGHRGFTDSTTKADGRLLHVYFADGHMPAQPANGQRELVKEDPPLVVVDTVGDETMMEIDENAQSREAENRLREERRTGGEDRRRQEDFPRGPRNDRRYNEEFRGPPRRAEPEYQDGRYGFGGGERYGGGGRGQGYRDDRRMYRGAQSWRP